MKSIINKIKSLSLAVRISLAIGSLVVWFVIAPKLNIRLYDNWMLSTTFIAFTVWLFLDTRQIGEENDAKD